MDLNEELKFISFLGGWGRGGEGKGGGWVGGGSGWM